MAYVNLIDLVYPVGSVYQSNSSTSPATLFGGSWDSIKDNFLVGAGNQYTNTSTGGEATHTLTIQEIPYHNHTCANIWEGTGSSKIDYSRLTYRDSGTGQGFGQFPTSYVGRGAAHNNLPPYYAVYIWVRTN